MTMKFTDLKFGQMFKFGFDKDIDFVYYKVDDEYFEEVNRPKAFGRTEFQLFVINTNLITCDVVECHQCENCDTFYTDDPVPYPDPDSKHARSTFCCDECAREAYEEVLVNAREDAREFEIWGTDYDSWYR